MKKFLIFSVLIIVMTVLLLGTRKGRDLSLKNSQSLSPTPAPFYDMTIPYFKGRTFSSKIGALNKVSDYANYSSYLTSYGSDGLRINALLTVPNGEMPKKGWPAIVFIHGYIPPSIYATEERYVDHVDYLARNGFVVLKIDLRGNGNSEGDASGAYYSGGYVVDALNAYSALQHFDNVNPEAVGFWGHSMAGNVVLRAVVSKPIPAAVIWAGAVYSYTDLQKYKLNDASYRPPLDASRRVGKRDQIFATYGQFDPKNSFWKTVAATNYLKDIKGAIELNHALDDDVVNIGYSRDLDKLLTEEGVTHEFYEYPTGGHNISGPSFTNAMENTVNFFKKYLK